MLLHQHAALKGNNYPQITKKYLKRETANYGKATQMSKKINYRNVLIKLCSFVSQTCNETNDVDAKYIILSENLG